MANLTIVKLFSGRCYTRPANSEKTMSEIERDFDRLALLDEGGWTHNNHYHRFLLRHVPSPCARALDVGCGTGAFARRLAEKSKQVVAIDLSAEMISVARSRSPQRNIEYRCADVMSYDWARNSFNCIVTIATLHHLPIKETILKLKEILEPNGVLIILDLFEWEHSLLTLAGWRDAASNLVAMGVSSGLRVVHNGRCRPPRAVRAAWEMHGKTDHYPSMKEVRASAAQILPGADIRKHLLWRYSLVWQNK